MKYICFISDLHISRPPPECGKIFDFFESLKEDADIEALYILGDFFEIWWGDDHNHAPYTEWERVLSSYPFPIYFLVGNRDFFCGKDFYERSGCIPLTAGHVIAYGSRHIALFHGDEPGLADPMYQMFRSIARGFLGQCFLKLPLKIRASLCRSAREKRNHKKPHYERPLQIDLKKWLQNCSIEPDIVINGHLHHPLKKEESGITRYQLGTWDDNHASYLRLLSNGEIDFFYD